MEKDHVIEQKICDTLEKNYMPYAMSVIISRAIPEIDGFKPSHRKLLYTMYKMGLLTGNRTKSSNVVGQTMKLNPHGEGAIYDTLVRLTRGNGALLLPLVDSKGNFGRQYSRDMAYAAPRYTEVKLDGVCSEIFKNIDKNTVAFMDNYDGTMKEPVLLPVSFPNILVNPNQGIAVGMASSICSFNLQEIVDATIAVLKSKDADITEYVQAPDFSTGGELIYKKEDMDAILAAGRGSFKVRGKYRFDKKNSCIEIYEIPYTTTCEAIIDKVVEAVKSNKVREVTDIRDETDLNGLKITLDIKRNTDVDALMARLYKITPLEDSFGCNFNILIDGHPRVMGVREIIGHWCDFRLGCVKGNLQYEIEEKGKRLHLLKGLQKILLDIDKAVQIIRNTEKEDEVIPNLQTGFSIDQLQAEYVAEIRLRNLNREYILRRTADIESLTAEIDKMNRILSKDSEVKKLICKELEGIAKKYGKPRRTILLDSGEIVHVKVEQMIEDYNVKLFLTRDNYFKKITLVSLRGSAEQKLKQDDEMICEVDASNKDDVLFFTNRGEVYKMRIHELTECKASEWGEYLPNLLALEEDEKILYITVASTYGGYMLFAFENGKIAKIDMQGYATKTNRRKLTGAYYAKVPLAGMLYIAQDCDIVLQSAGGRILGIDTGLITPKTKRDSIGVQVYLSKRDSKLQTMELAQTGEEAEDLSPYYSKKIPSSGAKPKEDEVIQLNMLD